MIKPEYKYSDLTGKIIGCAMSVHNVLGNGFQELIYQRSLASEFELQKIGFVRVGLLINFGNTKLEFHLLQNKKFKPS